MQGDVGMIKEVLELFIERPAFFGELILQHLRITAVAILTASVLGLAIGVFISEYKKIAPYVLGVINVMYTIPSIAFLGFLIPVTGIGDTTAIVALSVYALLPMVRNTYTGINNIDAAIVEAATGMGSTAMQILVKIKLPLAVPVIITGMRNMVVMTIALAGIASFIGAGGIGVAIYRGITTYNMPMTVAGGVLIAIIALIVDNLLGFFERKLLKRGRK